MKVSSFPDNLPKINRSISKREWNLKIYAIFLANKFLIFPYWGPIQKSIAHAIRLSQVNAEIKTSLTVKNTHIRFKISSGSVTALPESLANISEGYSQISGQPVKVENTGPGLAVCKAIIEAHEGFIWAEQNLDHGLSIGFEIPCVPATLAIST
jgi:K+-sensing histidine kinase KdpD